MSLLLNSLDASYHMLWDDIDDELDHAESLYDWQNESHIGRYFTSPSRLAGIMDHDPEPRPITFSGDSLRVFNGRG